MKTQTIQPKLLQAPLVALALAGLLSGCNSTPTPPTASAAMQINGTVISGSGTGTVTFSGQTGNFASAPVDASGAFSLTLPSADKFANELRSAPDVLSASGCSGTLNSSNGAAKGYGLATLDLNRQATGRIIAGSVSRSFGIPTSFEGSAWIYVTEDTTLTGNVDCKNLAGLGMSIPTSVQVNAKAGWNIVRVAASNGSSGIGGRIENKQDGPTTWKLMSQL